MKKVFLGILISSLLASPLTAYANENLNAFMVEKKFVLGDVDMNGQIDSTDYLRIKSDFLGVLELKGTEYAMADVNFDGVIDSTDYISIKKTLLEEMTLDDSAWEGQDSKLQFVGNDKFAMQISFQNTGGENFDFKMDSSAEVEIVSEGLLHNTNWQEIYPSYIKTLPQEKTVVNHKGEEVKVKHHFSDATITGEMYHLYKDSEWNFWYFNNNGEIVGVSLDKETLTTVDDKTTKDKETLINLGTQMANKIWRGKTFELHDALRVYDGYRLGYYRYVNGIKTTDYAEIWINNYGELTGWLYHDRGIDKYDVRSFNVNDDVTVYSEKIIEIGAELASKESFINGYLNTTKDQIANMKITIDEPSFGIGADGKLAGFTWITFEDEDSGFSKSEFVGFYAEERLSTANKVS